MAKYENNPKIPEKKEHTDYAWNLQTAKNFIAKVEPKLPKGMMLRVADSDGLKQSLMWISWTPPRETHVGTWANPIFLHQCRFAFGKELETVFNSYVHRVEDFEKKFVHN